MSLWLILLLVLLLILVLLGVWSLTIPTVAYGNKFPPSTVRRVPEGNSSTTLSLRDNGDRLRTDVPSSRIRSVEGFDVGLVDWKVADREFLETIESSTFFKSLTPWDLRVRNSKNREAYKQRYLNSRIPSLDISQEKVVTDLIKYIDDDLGVGSSVLGTVPWKIVFFQDVTEDGMVEGGLCHTMGSFIMFPIEYFTYSRERKISLLIHEKVHVLQRKNPAWAMDITKKLGFEVAGDMGTGGWIEDIRRHNPDLDSFDYGLTKIPGQRIVELYVGESSLLDTATFLVNPDGETKEIHSAEDLGLPSYISQIEHPYEMMACMVPVLVMRRVNTGSVTITDPERIVWDSLWQ
jgi:hypothetical protein